MRAHTVPNYHPSTDCMSLSELPHRHQTATSSRTFHLFQSLPWEIQLMIFEEFLATKDPRIVLLDVEEVDFCSPRDPGWFGWRLTAENRGQLHAKHPTSVARSLLGLCSASRRVATRFLNQPPDTICPPVWTAALTGLGLSLQCDIFWIPDEIRRFMEICDGFHYIHFRDWDVRQPFEEKDMHSIMISLDTFEDVVQGGTKIREDVDDSQKFVAAILGRDSLLRRFPQLFAKIRNLIVMVDIPRGHVSWDRIQVVGVDDPTAFTMSAEDGPSRCHSAFENYVALQSECMKLVVREREINEVQWREDELMGFDMGDYRPSPWEEEWYRPWPELSFAFLRP